LLQIQFIWPISQGIKFMNLTSKFNLLQIQDYPAIYMIHEFNQGIKFMNLTRASNSICYIGIKFHLGINQFVVWHQISFGQPSIYQEQHTVGVGRGSNREGKREGEREAYRGCRARQVVVAGGGDGGGRWRRRPRPATRAPLGDSGPRATPPPLGDGVDCSSSRR
jgi:hypothetical protein